MGYNSGNAIALLIFVFFLLKVIIFNIITFFIKEITSFLNKLLNFNNVFNNNFIIRSSGGTRR